PGRADVKLFLDNATVDQARRLFERFYPEHRHLASHFAERIQDRCHSMAALQNCLMLHRQDPEAAIREAGSMLGSLEVASSTAKVGKAAANGHANREMSQA